MAEEQNASTDDVTSALDSIRSDPDVVPSGVQAMTTTEEAKQEARKLLKRLGSTDDETSSIRRDLKQNAEDAKAALKRAQERLLAPEGQALFYPSDQENANRQAAALMHPNPGVGMAGALSAQFGNLYNEEAQQEEESRKGHLAGMNVEPEYQSQIAKINDTQLAARQKLLDMRSKQDTTLAGDAMKVLGRGIVPNKPGNLVTSPEGKQAVDELGPRAYNPDGSPSQELRDRVHVLVQAHVDEQKARAGTDEDPGTPDEKLASANANGVPASPSGLPDLSKLSTKGRINYYEKSKAAWDAQRKGLEESNATTQQALHGLDTFEELNKHVSTGPQTQPFTLGGVHAGPHGAGVDLTQEHGGLDLNPMSWVKKFDPDFVTMNKLAAQVVGQAIPAKGFGRVTNRDLNLFQQGSIGTDKTYPTNLAIIQALRSALKVNLERSQFEQSYYGTHLTTDGAEQAWQDYQKDNPMFDEKNSVPSHGQFILNPHRQSWQDYFRQKNGALQSAPVEHLEEHDSKLRAQADAALKAHGTNREDPTFAGSSDEQILSAFEPAKATGGRVGYDGGGPIMTPPANPGVPKLPPNPTPEQIREWMIAVRDYQNQPQGKAEGGQPDPVDGEDPHSLLTALKNGMTGKIGADPEGNFTPGTNAGGEFIGGGLTGAALLMLARRNPRLAELAFKYPGLTAAGAGAGAGALSGGMSENDTALGGALKGATIGAAAGAGARGLTKLATAAGDAATGSGINTGTRRSIQAILHDTGGDWGEVANILQRDAKLKVPSLLGEIGPRSRGLTMSALRKDTPETAQLGSEIQERQVGAPGRVEDQVNQSMAPDNYAVKTQELKDHLYTKAAPLYDQAFQQFPSVQSQSLSQIMATPSGQEAVGRARKMMADQQLPVAQPGQNGVSLQFLDQVKRSLDDMITQEEGVGPSYQATNQGRVLRQMRSQLVDELDKATTGPKGQPSPYRAARDQYAGDLDVLDSLRSGREMFPKLTADDVRATMQKLDYSSRDAFRSGVAEGLFQQIQGMGPNRNAAQAVIGNPKLQEKLGALFDNPAQAQKFISALQREAEIFKSGQKMSNASEKGMELSAAPTSVSQMMRASLMGKGTASDIADTMGTGALDKDSKAKIARLRDVAERLRSRQGDLSLLSGAAGAGAGVAASDSPHMDIPTVDQGQQ